MQLTPGDQCNACFAGRMKVRSVYDSGGWHTRYLICTKCGQRCQHVVPADEVKRRTLKQKSGSA